MKNIGSKFGEHGNTKQFLPAREENMGTRKGIILQGPWTEQINITKLSPDQLATQAQRYLANITVPHHSLHSAQYLFKEIGGGIRPVHCRKAISTLNETNERARELSVLLDEGVDLPESVVPMRYQLLVALQRVEEQACELTILIDSFRAVCMSLSQHALRQRREISDNFETLVEYISDIPVEVDLLMDKVPS